MIKPGMKKPSRAWAGCSLSPVSYKWKGMPIWMKQVKKEARVAFAANLSPVDEDRQMERRVGKWKFRFFQ
jgi:hypothetical protein